MRHGVSWAVRLDFVLALATSWPAFQTLIYRVAADGPDELATILLPSAGLPTGATAERIQSAYDALRLGTEAEPRSAAASTSAADSAATSPSAAPPRPRAGQPPLPQTASLLVVFTAGVGGALRIALGVLLALGPLVVLGCCSTRRRGWSPGGCAHLPARRWRCSPRQASTRG